MSRLAAWLWRLFRACVRGFFHFVPASAGERRAAETLRADIKALSGQNVSADVWSKHRVALRQAILRRDPRTFLTWDVIANTMAPPAYARFVRMELRFLKTHEWVRWSGVISRNWLAKANSIHQAYHLCRFQAETGKTVRDFELILEFGGGYGEMRRIVHELGFSGPYLIFDLPEQIALQRYYLALNGDLATAGVSDFQALRAAIVREPEQSRKLFIATWSFDETPLAVREAWPALLSRFHAFLIAYQAEFGGIDNQAFFAEWQSRFPGVAWSCYAIPQVKDSFYLFGTARLAS